MSEREKEIAERESLEIFKRQQKELSREQTKQRDILRGREELREKKGERTIEKE